MSFYELGGNMLSLAIMLPLLLIGFFGLFVGLVFFSQGVIEPELHLLSGPLCTRQAGKHNMGLYVLLLMVVVLVIYLFYAVIHPERF